MAQIYQVTAPTSGSKTRRIISASASAHAAVVFPVAHRRNFSRHPEAGAQQDRHDEDGNALHAAILRLHAG